MHAHERDHVSHMNIPDYGTDADLSPKSVAEAWGNHLESVTKKNIDNMMLRFTEVVHAASVLCRWDMWLYNILLLR